jgi:hypothetical protein
MSPSLPLTPVQERVLSLIGTGSTISDAARSVGVHRNTIGNWIRSSPLFKDGLACAQYDQVLFWREHAQLLADSALQAIQQIIEDDRATGGAERGERCATPPPRYRATSPRPPCTAIRRRMWLEVVVSLADVGVADAVATTMERAHR